MLVLDWLNVLCFLSWMIFCVEKAHSEGTDVAGVLKIRIARAPSSGAQNRNSAQNASALPE